MSNRAILLATTMCIALASAATIDPASAHGGSGGGGGGGFGGSFHSSGPGSISHGPSLAPVHTFSPVQHFTQPLSVTKMVPAPAKALDHPIHLSMPLSPKVTNPTSVGTGAPINVHIPVSTKVPSIPGAATGLGPAGSLPPGVGSLPPGATTPSAPFKPGQQIHPGAANETGAVIASVPPIQGPGAPPPPAAKETPMEPQHPHHPEGGIGTLSISGPGFVGADVVVEDECYWVKRKLLTPDGEVIRRVKYCEIANTDQDAN